METDAWAIVTIGKGLNVKTVSPTRRAAIVNWLADECGVLMMFLAHDEYIEKFWEKHAEPHGAMVRQVVILSGSDTAPWTKT